MYTIEEFDKEKTKVVKYIVYKKRTEQEIRNKFSQTIEENLLEDIIDYLKENGYINDTEYIEKAIKEFINLQNLSIKEIMYKLYAKGIEKEEIDKYLSYHEDELQKYEISSAKKILQKKQTSMELQNIENYLLKKGYARSSIRQAIKEVEE